MKKLKHEKRTTSDWKFWLISKQDEIVDWINEHEKQVRPSMREAVEMMIEDMKREKKESRGETINRLLKGKPECKWGPGGGHEKHSQKR